MKAYTHITPAEVIRTYDILGLTQDEADTLYAVTRYIGGSPAGRRGDMSRLQRALDDAGYVGKIVNPPGTGTIYFSDTRGDSH